MIDIEKTFYRRDLGLRLSFFASIKRKISFFYIVKISFRSKILIF
jgi:hypothetical protein